MYSFLRKIGLDTINGYSFKKQIGEGKSSTVCLYRNLSGHKCVVKILIAPRKEKELELFENEVAILSTLNKNKYKNHNIPKLIASLKQYKDFPIHYYVMEFIEGITLAKYFEDNPAPWNYITALKMLYCVTAVLSRISMDGIVHRDLHSGNIILRNSFDLEKQFGQEDIDIVIMDLGCHKNWFLDFFNIKNIENNKYFRFPGTITTWSPEFLKNPHMVDYKHDI